MNKKLLIPAAALLLAAQTASADMLRDILSSGATTASTYLTFKDNKQATAAREDASSFVASDGQIRGPWLEAWLKAVRDEHPGLAASDMELASALLAAQ